MDRFSERRPTILVYSRRIAQDIRAWLLDHDVPGTVLAASSPEEARPLMGDVEILFGAGFSTAVVASAPRLQWIQSMNAGIEELAADWIPNSVTVTRVVGQFGNSIAEYVFAELLARVREIERTRTAQRERRWEHFVSDTLEGKTLGVAGLGSIGREIVRKGRAFDMRVHGMSRTGESAGTVDRHFGPDEWPKFAAGIDVLVLTLPRTAETEGIVGRAVLETMRSDAVLINVDRGALVNEAALIEAVRERRIGGAILDVFQEEPLPESSALWSTPHVIVTPHISGPSTVEGVSQYFLANLERFRRGEPLIGVVDRTSGY